MLETLESLLKKFQMTNSDSVRLDHVSICFEVDSVFIMRFKNVLTFEFNMKICTCNVQEQQKLSSRSIMSPYKDRCYEMCRFKRTLFLLQMSVKISNLLLNRRLSVSDKECS